MHPSVHARDTPEKPAYVMADTGEAVAYEKLNRRSNQAAHLFRAFGLSPGDTVALVLENTLEFFEIVWGAQRAGLYYACLSAKLSPAEAAYIVADSGAKLLIASAGLAESEALGELVGDVARLGVGGPIAGYDAYESARDTRPETPISDETAGADLLYSSGTTGRPKGVKFPLSGAAIDAPAPLTALAAGLYGIGADTVYLSPAPLYHAAPLRWCMAVHRLGGATIVMPKFDPETFLELIERHRVTATQLVPTMLVRMLKLPESVRRKYDLSSLRMAVHAAAPCPIPIKEQIIDWWGPVVHEYYAGTEGNGFCTLNSEEWLRKKGSVGRPIIGEVKICSEDGAELPTGSDGIVYFAGGASFEYHNDPQKTAQSRHPRHPDWSTLGDIGRVDEDGYLYLTDRKAFMIISGGVNIYPQEVENLLIAHPKVADAAVFGVPNEEFGEEVKAVVQPLAWGDAGPDLAAELIGYCRAQLSHVKCPRSIDFLQELPRHPTGKLMKRLLRDQYWGDRASRIV